MDFDVKSLSGEELAGAIVILDSISCVHHNTVCKECPCFKFCMFLREVWKKCDDALKEVVSG